jgi:hypothetical protein
VLFRHLPDHNGKARLTAGWLVFDLLSDGKLELMRVSFSEMQFDGVKGTNFACNPFPSHAKRSHHCSEPAPGRRRATARVSRSARLVTPSGRANQLPPAAVPSRTEPHDAAPDRGVLIAGHGRVLGAKRLGLQQVPVIRLGQVLLTAARLYQGQTTNFRTPGGGFAPVFAI